MWRRRARRSFWCTDSGCVRRVLWTGQHGQPQWEALRCPKPQAAEPHRRNALDDLLCGAWAARTLCQRFTCCAPTPRFAISGPCNCRDTAVPRRPPVHNGYRHCEAGCGPGDPTSPAAADGNGCAAADGSCWGGFLDDRAKSEMLDRPRLLVGRSSKSHLRAGVVSRSPDRRQAPTRLRCKATPRI